MALGGMALGARANLAHHFGNRLRQVDWAGRTPSATASQGSKDPKDPKDLMDEHRRQMFDLSQGWGDRIMEDEQYGAALQRLRDAMGGGGPFTEEVQNAIVGQQADRLADAEQARNAMMRRQYASRGGSIDDPAFQSELAANMAQRQQGVNAAGRDMLIQAALGNYDAQNHAAGQLASVRGAQIAQASSPYAQASGQHQGLIYATGDQGNLQPPRQVAAAASPRPRAAPRQDRWGQLTRWSAGTGSIGNARRGAQGVTAKRPQPAPSRAEYRNAANALESAMAQPNWTGVPREYTQPQGTHVLRDKSGYDQARRPAATQPSPGVRTRVPVRGLRARRNQAQAPTALTASPTMSAASRRM